MVVFNELRITQDGQYLILDTHIRRDLTIDYPNAQIDEIYLCESGSYKEGDAKSNPEAIRIYKAGDEGNNEELCTRSEVYLKISPSDSLDLPSTFKDKLFLVYVYVTGINELDLTCGCNNKNPSIGVALDMGLIYRQFMNYINDLLCNKDSCSPNVSQGFTDFVLRYNAFLLAMDSGHYKKGIEFFDKWFSNDSNVVTSSYCGCHC